MVTRLFNISSSDQKEKNDDLLEQQVFAKYPIPKLASMINWTASGFVDL